MITVGLYCEVEDPDKFSEPFLFHLLRNAAAGRSIFVESRRIAS